MATSHSGWGNCPAHKKNQLAMYPGVSVLSYRLFSIGTVVTLGLDPGWCRLYGTLCTSTTHEHIDSSKSLDLRS